MESGAKMSTQLVRGMAAYNENPFAISCRWKDGMTTTFTIRDAFLAGQVFLAYKNDPEAVEVAISRKQ